MGFQGDVAGIGLGELLQGLARGGREGVLTLFGGGRCATIGLREGQILLLPEPDEDPEVWRARMRQAWVQGVEAQADHQRMREIATAARMEGVFHLLDSEGLHFRFEPGPLPQPTEASLDLDNSEDSTPRIGPSAPGAVHSAPMVVEYLLLEYARISDEGRTYGDSTQLAATEVPRVVNAQEPPQDSQRFWQQCDGMSTLSEIADRLGWPLRYCQSVTMEMIHKGQLRFADAREMLVLSQHEFAQNRFARAASRLSAWIRSSTPGLIPQGDAELLLMEWESGRLQASLQWMEPKYARSILRRLDNVLRDIGLGIERWQELRKVHRNDAISEWHENAMRIRLGTSKHAPSTNALLRLARTFQENNQKRRAAVLLRVVAASQPESNSIRMELGTRMLAVGMVEDAGAWILEASRTLIDGNLGDKAMAPLRQLILANSANREARQLLTLARARSAYGRRRRRNAAIGLCLLLIVSGVAIVQLRMEQDMERRFNEVLESSHEPKEALALLVQNFPDDSSDRVHEVRERLRQTVRSKEDGRRDDWLDIFRAVQLECTHGDPKLGLIQSLEMPAPPQLQLSKEDWPPVGDLLSALAGQLEETIDQWSEPEIVAVPSEKRLSQLILDLGEILQTTETEWDTTDFVVRLDNIKASLATREEARHSMIAEEERQELIDVQNELLVQARAHVAASDLARAIAAYDELFETDGRDTLRKVLDDEYREAKLQLDAVRQAMENAERGNHTAAIKSLSEGTAQPGAFLLPWTVQTSPPGGRVFFDDGSERVAPFRMHSSIEEKVKMRIELEGHETLELEFESPSDVLITLSRVPNLAWLTNGSIEAAPVAVKDDYVVCDRAGEIASIGMNGQVRWAHSIDTLGGISRAPVFLPRKPGWLVAITEDGESYLIEAETGQLQGPWTMGSAPVWGPIATGSSVLAFFRDGKSAEWESRLKPEITEAAGTPPNEADRLGSDSGFRMLRNDGTDQNELIAHSEEWKVTVLPELFAVERTGGESERFFVRRRGDWSYVAWEAPRADLASGRLWIADGSGLRGFVP